jgi:hypothetical protein
MPLEGFLEGIHYKQQGSYRALMELGAATAARETVGLSESSSTPLSEEFEEPSEPPVSFSDQFRMEALHAAQRLRFRLTQCHAEPSVLQSALSSRLRALGWDPMKAPPRKCALAATGAHSRGTGWRSRHPESSSTSPDQLCLELRHLAPQLRSRLVPSSTGLPVSRLVALSRLRTSGWVLTSRKASPRKAEVTAAAASPRRTRRGARGKRSGRKPPQTNRATGDGQVVTHTQQ